MERSQSAELSRPLLNAANNTSIPSFKDISSQYASKWDDEKEKFYATLKENFKQLTSQWRSGKQEIYELNETKLGGYTGHYEKAFRELFSDPAYEAHVGTTERVGSGQNKVKKLYITLPDCFSL